MNFVKKTLLCVMSTLLVGIVNAQQTYEEIGMLTMNGDVTTVITASEPVLFVDISTDKVAGDQPMENIIRLKPKEGPFIDGEVLGIVTIVTERYRTQYSLIYTVRMEEAVSDKMIELYERSAYDNPLVSMSTEEMARFARRIWNSPAKIRNIGGKANHMVMRVNNIYAVGDYFFIDFSIQNKTNIRFDINELRVSLNDKKIYSATHSQTVVMEPVMILEKTQSFLHGYRNVIVLKKLTFPNAKVLTIEIDERQISGRSISMSIDYDDILKADTFDNSLLKED